VFPGSFDSYTIHTCCRKSEYCSRGTRTHDLVLVTKNPKRSEGVPLWCAVPVFFQNPEKVLNLNRSSSLVLYFSVSTAWEKGSVYIRKFERDILLEENTNF